MLIYGLSAGDSKQAPVDDAFTTFPLSFNFSIKGSFYSSANIYANGRVGFDNKSSFYPWGFDGITTAYGAVYYRELNAADLNTQSNIVRSNGYPTFNATVGFMVTWDNVQVYHKTYNNTMQFTCLADGEAKNTYFVSNYYAMQSSSHSNSGFWSNFYDTVYNFYFQPTNGSISVHYMNDPSKKKTNT
jgi:hypothetical protein